MIDVDGTDDGNRALRLSSGSLARRERPSVRLVMCQPHQCAVYRPHHAAPAGNVDEKHLRRCHLLATSTDFLTDSFWPDGAAYTLSW